MRWRPLIAALPPRGDDDLAPIAGGVPLRAEAFVVEELLEPPSPGPWRWVALRYRDRTTEAVAARLATWYDVPPHRVGWAGRKDRQAITLQWFSLPPEAADLAPPPEFEHVATWPADGPLRLGRHRGNRFVVQVELAERLSPNELEVRTARLARGFPNLFGPQRFGRDGRNAERGGALLRRSPRRRPRRHERLLLHAWQAELFNRIVAAWLAAGGPADPEDLVWHPGAGTALPRSRYPEGVATAPLWGASVAVAGGAAGARERSVLADSGWEEAAFRVRAAAWRLWGTRRPMWVLPQRLSVRQRTDGYGLEVTAELPPGSYMTVLVAALLGWPATAVGDRPRGSSVPHP